MDIIFTGNAGGFDHILEPVIVGGRRCLFGAYVPISIAFSSTPWIIGTVARVTANGTPMTLVGDPGSPLR